MLYRISGTNHLGCDGFGARWQKAFTAGVVYCMRSYPVIQSSTSQTEKQFDCFVEHYAHGRDALYQADGDDRLPGDTVRISVTGERAHEDVAFSRHVVEFMSLGADGHWQRAGCVGHSMKEIETMSGRWMQIESTFQIAGPGIPHGRRGYAEVEPAVQAQLDRLRDVRLLPLRAA